MTPTQATMKILTDRRILHIGNGCENKRGYLMSDFDLEQAGTAKIWFAEDGMPFNPAFRWWARIPARSHDGYVPIRFAHCDNQARIVGTSHVFTVYGHTYDGLLYGTVRLNNRYGDVRCITFLCHEHLSPLWRRQDGAS